MNKETASSGTGKMSPLLAVSYWAFLCAVGVYSTGCGEWDTYPSSECQDLQSEREDLKKTIADQASQIHSKEDDIRELRAKLADDAPGEGSIGRGSTGLRPPSPTMDYMTWREKFSICQEAKKDLSSHLEECCYRKAASGEQTNE